MDELLFYLVLFLANVIQTITGFAGNLLAMPFSMNLVGYDSARVVINIFTMIACFIIAKKNFQHIKWKILVYMLVIMAAGMLFSLLFLSSLGLDILQKVYAIIILMIACNKLFISKSFVSNKLLDACIIFCAGIIHELFLSGGALLVVYLINKVPDKNEFRATIASVWVVLDFVLIFEHLHSNLFIDPNIRYILISMIPLCLSIKIGQILYKKVSSQYFLKLTYILLIISGLSILF